MLPISEKYQEYAEQVEKELKANGIRCKIDDRSEKIGFKIRETRLARVPYMLVVGQKEQEENKVFIQRFGNNRGFMGFAGYGAGWHL